MIYILALIGLITLAILMWRAFGPSLLGRTDNVPRSMGPDDDPDFLWRLGRDVRRDKSGPHSDGNESPNPEH
ncbi:MULTISPECIES: hypothetical protein [Hoyosella]|uniref:Uncharacterized protein n=2 Tax=Hoyosella TaxID=697025 RepID=F6EH01_HOYSD|nr:MULTISPECIES: hypothetical protein [Hoyosella]AEF38825.1 hypothetical protein AS9A_0366 [Hoyosella subflava DQS3-9A1]MBB3037734.1 hypothetical protein [Hoyosella altamirensis]